MKKYYKTIIGNYGVSEEIFDLIINNEALIENYSMSLQDRIDNESNDQITIVVTDIENSKNDELIISLINKIEKKFHYEVIEFINICKEVSEEGIDNLNIHIM